MVGKYPVDQDWPGLMTRQNPLHLGIWLVGTVFTLLQFFLQLSSGIIIDLIMHEMNLSAFNGGLLSGSFYVIYTLLQIPVGLLCDRQPIRPILVGSALICALGALVFASGHQLWSLYLGRILLSIGSAFSFVCLIHLIRQHYPKRYFGLLLGITETLSFLVTVVGMITLASLEQHWNWRQFMTMIAVLALAIAYLCWRFIPNTKPKHIPNHSYVNQVVRVLSNGKLWTNGVFIGLCFAMITVFAGLWAPQFLQIKLQCNLKIASILDALFILGVSISCPIFVYLANRVIDRRMLIIRGCGLTVLIFIILVWIPTQSEILIGGLMLLLGLVSGSYILGYGMANEYSAPNSQSTATGMTNTLALSTTPLMQPLIGFFLDQIKAHQLPEILDYQLSLMLIPLGVIIAAWLVSRSLLSSI